MFFECLGYDLSNLFTSEIKERYKKNISDVLDTIVSDNDKTN